MNALVTAAQLREMLGDADLRVYDCSVHLRPDPGGSYTIESGHADYREGHIPGAGFLDLDGELSRKDTRLRFMLPDPDDLARAFARAGIGNEHQVVLYASNHAMWATRVWWMLASLGHPRVAVLDGGLAAWRDAGGEIERGENHYPPAKFTPHFDSEWWADKSTVEAAIGDATVCTINALPAPVHSGEAAVNYGRKGHIAGSVNVPYDSVLDESGRFRPIEEITKAFAAHLGDDRPVITYCGGGISATVDAFALRLIGKQDVRVYDGSMSEWAADPNAPMETGAS